MAPKSKASPKKAAGVKKTAKKEKDPNAPKKPLSAYMYYAKDNRDAIKKANPSLSFGELGREMGQKWAALPDSGKAKYNALAAKDKERYEKEKAKYGK